MREEWGRVLAALIAFLRDFELAEDSLQDALVAALETWPESGLPDAPRAWLMQTAKRKAIDKIRRAKRFDDKRSDVKTYLENELADGIAEMDQPIPDERLALIFTCCHPALSEMAQVALTLKALGGLTTAEIARAFLVEEKTMAQRIVRAKRKIKRANIPYQVPDGDVWPERLNAVLATIYFIFNEGYAATSGDSLVRADLCEEAIRLARLLAQLTPHEPEAAGLLALLLLHDSRRSARTDAAGGFIPLQAQDRSLWNQEQIAEGCARTMAALARKKPGPYQIQAAISAVHSEAPSHDKTDWREIVLLYGKLYELTPSPVILLNGAVALSYAFGAEAGLAALEEIESSGELQSYQPFHAARADLLRRTGRAEAARLAYQKAIELSQNSSETAFLTMRMEQLKG